MAFIAVTFFIALLPGFIQMMNMAQNSENLNCHGYVDYNDASLSANASRAEASSIACLAIKLYLPYIVLAVLIGLVASIFYGRATSPGESIGGY